MQFHPSGVYGHENVASIITQIPIDISLPREYIDHMNRYNLSTYELNENSKWSGKQAVPAISETVNVTMNGLGKGIVRGYFVEDVWLGIYVELSNPPEWWIKQMRHADSSPARKPGCTMVFGTEIQYGSGSINMLDGIISAGG